MRIENWRTLSFIIFPCPMQAQDGESATACRGRRPQRVIQSRHVGKEARRDHRDTAVGPAHSRGVAVVILGKDKANGINRRFYFTVAVKEDWLKSLMRKIFKSRSVRGVKLSRKAEYCGTPQSKERRNREYKVCLNERTLRLLDPKVSLLLCTLRAVSSLK